MQFVGCTSELLLRSISSSRADLIFCVSLLCISPPARGWVPSHCPSPRSERGCRTAAERIESPSAFAFQARQSAMARSAADGRMNSMRYLPDGLHGLDRSEAKRDLREIAAIRKEPILRARPFVRSPPGPRFPLPAAKTPLIHAEGGPEPMRARVAPVRTPVPSVPTLRGDGLGAAAQFAVLGRRTEAALEEMGQGPRRDRAGPRRAARGAPFSRSGGAHRSGLPRRTAPRARRCGYQQGHRT